jgi:hypothetical protein
MLLSRVRLQLDLPQDFIGHPVADSREKVLIKEQRFDRRTPAPAQDFAQRDVRKSRRNQTALAICQLLTAPLFAWFLELRSVAKQSARPNPPALGPQHQISLAETRMQRHPLPSRTVQATSFTPSVERSFNECKAN